VAIAARLTIQSQTFVVIWIILTLKTTTRDSTPLPLLALSESACKSLPLAHHWPYQVDARCDYRSSDSQQERDRLALKIPHS